MIHPITRLFPFWRSLFCAAAWYRPTPFAALQPAVLPLLGVVMYGMGMTLTVESFAFLRRRPLLVALTT